jgi:hypothetical protein
LAEKAVKPDWRKPQEPKKPKVDKPPKKADPLTDKSEAIYGRRRHS